MILDQHADDTNLFASQVEQGGVRANPTVPGFIVTLHPIKAFPTLYFTLNAVELEVSILKLAFTPQ